MKPHTTMRLLFAIVFQCVLAGITAIGVAGEIPFLWIGPNQENADQLTTTPWPADAAREIRGIKLYIGWLSKAPDEQLARMATLVRERDLQVSVELGGLLNPDWQDQIGEKSAASELPPLRRWRDAGGRLDQIELDGPERRAKGFASWGKDPSKKITDYQVIAQQIDIYLGLVAKEFPHTRFILLVNFPNWGWRGKPSYHGRGENRQDFGDYFAALAAVLPIVQAAQPKFSGLMIDNPYDYASAKATSAKSDPQNPDDWFARIADLRAVVTTYGMTCGLVLNSERGGKTSDEDFSNDTLAYATAVVRHGIVFDQAAVQSWYAHPTTVVGPALPAQTAVALEVARILHGSPQSIAAAPQPPASSKPIMGAIRWDFWTKGNEAKREAMIKDGKETWGQHRNLQDITWADRLPFFAMVVSENPRRVEIYEDSSAVMDQEIAFAKQSGLDYWAFLYYHDIPEMNLSLDLYRKNPRRNDIRYAMILAGTRPYTKESPWEAQIAMMVRDAGEPNYLRVLGDRPLIFIFLWGDKHHPTWLWGSVEQARAAMDLLRARFRQAGLGNPYIAAMRGDVKKCNEYREQLGLDAVSSYTNFAKTDYAGLAASNVAWWEQGAALGTPVVLPVSCGWGGPRPSGPILQQPTAEQFKQQVRTARRWIDEHPAVAPSRALLFYAWNEFDEGGFLCPTLGEKDGDRKIDWLRAVVAE